MKDTETSSVVVSRNYKDTVFRKLFQNETALMHLYNAVMGADHKQLDEFQIAGTENPIYIGMRNDVAFIADLQVHIYEHQSTINPNMPLRDLFYVTQLYGRYLKEKNIFSTAVIKVPAPHFIVFYNGKQKQPEIVEYRLSDLYAVKSPPFQMELIVKVININIGCNEKLVQQCAELYGYQQFVHKVRQHRNSMNQQEAIERSVHECIEENILKDFFLENRKEVIEMSLWEFDQEKYDAMLREEGERRGRAEGKAEGKAEERSLLNQLTICLLEDGRLHELKKSVQDQALQNQLLEEYCLI